MMSNNPRKNTNQTGDDDDAGSAPKIAPPGGMPVVVLATREQARGGGQRLGGLTIAERTVRQLLKVGYPQIILADDGTIPLPATWPETVLVQKIENPGDELPKLREQWTAENVATLQEFPADVVRPRDDDLDFEMRITDEASCLRAERAVFRELGRANTGLVDRLVNKRLSVPFTRRVLGPLVFTPLQLTLARAAIGLLGLFLIVMGSYFATLLGFILLAAQQILALSIAELGRLRFQQGDEDQRLGVIVGDVIEIALYVAAAIGTSGAAGSGRLLVTGLFSTALIILRQVVVYRQRLSGGQKGFAEAFAPINWWYTTPEAEKERRDRLAVGDVGASDIVLAAGQADFIILAWGVLALLGMYKMIIVYGLVVALVKGVSAGIQLMRSTVRTV